MSMPAGRQHCGQAVSTPITSVVAAGIKHKHSQQGHQAQHRRQAVQAGAVRLQQACRQLCTTAPRRTSHRWKLGWQSARLVKIAVWQAVHKCWLILLVCAQKACFPMDGLDTGIWQSYYHKILPKLLCLANCLLLLQLRAC